MRMLPGPGPRDERIDAPWTRTERTALVALILGCLAGLPLTVHPWFDPTPDGSMYLITARSLLDGLGPTLFGEPFHLRPPGFAVIIAPVLAAVGTDFSALHTLVSLFGIAGVACLFVFQRPRIGWLPAVLVSAGLWISPGYQKLCNQVMSDVPGVAMLLAALLVERWSARSPSTRREIALGLCIGAFAYVRTAVVLLVPAVLVSRVVERLLGEDRTPWPAFLLRRCAPVVIVTAAVQLPWSLANRPPENAPPADQTARFSYGTGMWHSDEGDPSSPRLGPAEIVRERFPARVADMAGSFGTALLRDDVTPARVLLALVFVLSSFRVLVRRRAPADFFVFGAMALFSVYFGYKPRLLLPVYVIALPAVLESLGDLARRVGGPRARYVVVPAAALLYAALSFQPRHEWDSIRRTDGFWRAAAREVSAALPPDARVATSLGWHWAALLGRPVYTLHYQYLRTGDAGRATEEIVDRYGLNTVFLYDDLKGDVPFREALHERYGGSIRRDGPVEVVRVRP